MQPRRRVGPVVAILAAAGLALLVLPLLGLLFRAPWGQIPTLVAGDVVLQALGLSLLTAVISTVLCLVFGIPLAVLLSHSVGWPVIP
ncbi:MAG: molybdate ABC transporter permease subunit, partial [Pseudolysinimonas sp.]